jgi:HAD superfamily hydrolase (TIGR01509 family)
MIKVVIFDGVNCITYQEPLSVGLERDYKIPLEETLPFFKGELQDCVAGKSDLKEILPQYLKAWGWKEGVDSLLRYWFERDHKIDTKLVSYILELKNKGILCLLATNNEKYRFAYMLNKMGFNKIFDKAYCSALISCKKPDQQFFQKIFDDLKDIKKQEILFFDDKAENVKGAKEFGIHAEIYTTFEDFQEKMKKYVV